MKTEMINIRVSDTEKRSLARAARLLNESLSSFLLESALMRLKSLDAAALSQDPFEAELRRLTSGQRPEEVSKDLLRRVQASRSRRQKGGSGLSAREAASRVSRWRGEE